ncbi:MULTISPECIES: hypothetical protein [Brevibacterium]|uniref:Uncharacterized protein n=3 Tax=Brevibacterium casei TaxID=33889 RepID=K9AVB9_9MICO|nr:hypothetical protein [Brevibacterium casei]NJE67486.1 hypothetical protein [Brevibacterium sp. LS14]HCD82550.1 hypothetical protein [Agrobacterium sp.]EKU45375.1 hypothetical protein C272_15235 [Brevibacterium casei S18]MCT1766445.1 hypothetical protein [Brevibacterium casei]MCT2183176.1 hypothetical protein [Brevibacterium casei]
MNKASDDSLGDAPAEELKTNVNRSENVSDLAGEIAQGVKQRNGQQKILFVGVCFLVVISFLLTVILVFMLGIGNMELTASGQVAAIAAFGVQPFILVGVLTSNVYRGSPFELSDKSNGAN